MSGDMCVRQMPLSREVTQECVAQHFKTWKCVGCVMSGPDSISTFRFSRQHRDQRRQDAEPCCLFALMQPVICIN